MTNNIRLKPIGLNNRLPITQLDVPTPRDSTPVWLAVAENVDILGGSYVRRRNGFALATPGIWHSLWGAGADTFGVREEDGVASLYRLSSVDGAVQTDLVAVLDTTQKLHYTSTPDGNVYVSDGVQLRRIEGMALVDLGVEPPNLSPIAFETSGGLPVGRYQVFFTSIGAAGESCSTAVQTVFLPNGGGIAFSGLTADTAIYATDADGVIFNEVHSRDYVSLGNEGGECGTFMLKPMPAGHSLCHYKGSLFSAVGQWLYISEPYRYGAYYPGRGFIPFPADISIVAPCEDGIYVCADKTYWLPNDPLDTSPVVVLPHGALPGSVAFDEDAVVAYWQCDNGVILAKPGGVVEAVQDEALKFRKAALGHSWVREQGGDKHLITTRFGATSY